MWYNDMIKVFWIVTMELITLMKGLIIKEPWIDLILDKKKKWEIRGTATKIRGRILLIKSGTGCVWGEADLVDCFSISIEQLQNTYFQHRIPIEKISSIRYGHPHVWVLANPKRYGIPVPYNHPNGAIVWVNIDYKEGGQTNE